MTSISRPSGRVNKKVHPYDLPIETRGKYEYARTPSPRHGGFDDRRSMFPPGDGWEFFGSDEHGFYVWRRCP